MKTIGWGILILNVVGMILGVIKILTTGSLESLPGTAITAACAVMIYLINE